MSSQPMDSRFFSPPLRPRTCILHGSLQQRFNSLPELTCGPEPGFSGLQFETRIASLSVLYARSVLC